MASISEEMNLDERLFRNLAGRTGKDWKQLGTTLGFSAAQIEAFTYNNRDNLEEQAFQMFIAWRRKQATSDNVARDRLAKALVEIGRADMAATLSDVIASTFDISTCSKAIANHYIETMKVSTYPLAEERAMGMSELHVNSQLLRETNRQHGNCAEGSTFQPGPEKIPLDSYNDMLRPDGPGTKRILVIAETGYGKSTLFKRIAYDWALIMQSKQSPIVSQSPLARHKLVFLLNVNLMSDDFNVVDAIFSQILTDSYTFTKRDLEAYIQKYPDDVLFLLDGADEVSFQTLDGTNRVDNVKGVLSFKSLKSCRVIVSSRHFTALKLLKWYPHFTRIQVTGFNDENRQEYVGKYLNNYEAKYQSELLKEVRNSQTLRTLGEIPLLFWLMCTTWENCHKLPNRVTKLFNTAIRILFEHRVSKTQGSSSDRFTRETFNDLMMKLGRVALEGLLNPSGVKIHFKRTEFDSESLVTLGCEVGLLSHTKSMHGLDELDYITFLHKTFQEYCAATYLADLASSNPDTFRQNVSQILEGDVDTMEYLLRFCCGLNTTAAEVIIGLVNEKLTSNDLDTFVGFLYNYMSLNGVMMLLLFEADLDSLVRAFSDADWVRFSCMLQGEDLLAAHYFVTTLGRSASLPHISDIYVTCHSLADIRLVKDLMRHKVPTKSLDLHGINMNGEVETLKDICKHALSLFVSNCNLNIEDISRLFGMISETGNIISFDLSNNNMLSGLLPEKISPAPSLTSLNISGCSLTKDNIVTVFLYLSALGNVKRVNMMRNNLHGLLPVQVCNVLSLDSLILSDCGLKKGDMKALFYILSAAGNIRWVCLSGNNFHGLKKGSVTPLSSLLSLDLTDCGLENSDVNAVLCILSSLGNIQRVNVNDNNLDGVLLASKGLVESHESESEVTSVVENNKYINIFCGNRTYTISRDNLRFQKHSRCILN